MQIGCGEYQMVWESNDLYLVEDLKEGAYTLYRIKDTVMHPNPELADKLMDEPYDFDALTGVMRLFTEVGSSTANPEGLERLMALVE